MTQENRTIDVVIPVYNDNSYLMETLNSIFKQKLPPFWSMQVYIVDDGSDFPISFQNNNHNVHVVRVVQNKGRAKARNYGVRKGSGDYIYMLDVDCILRNENTLKSHVQVLSEPFVSASCGQIISKGNYFWARYQTEVFQNREQSFIKGDNAALTTTNFMITRDAFDAIGGFDTDFTHYGFEDKDFLLRLVAKEIGIRYCSEASVEHMSGLTLISVCKKMKESGKYSSKIFIKTHSEYYKKMSYGRVSKRFSKGIFKMLIDLSKPLFWSSIRAIDWCISAGVVPYFLAKKLVKYASGLAYVHGTTESKG